MSRHAYTTKGSLIVAFLLVLAACGKQDEPAAPPTASASAPAFPAGNANSLADCDKLPDPKPRDDSAAGRATAVSEGVAARAACKKAAANPQANADLARIREIKEKEQADLAARKVSEEEWKRGVKEGSSQPIRELKY